MSIAQLHELTAALNTKMENARTKRSVSRAEFDLLAKIVLQGVHEVLNMAQRLDAIERHLLARGTGHE